jgi:NitT/TauT family transport system permease protein
MRGDPLLRRIADAELRRWQVVVGRLVVLAALIGVWWWAAAANWGGRGTIPTPREVADAIRWAFESHTVRAAAGQTLTAWALGLAITIVLGILVGLVIGLSETAWRSTRGLIDFLRAVPPVALIPLGVLIVGVSTTLKVAMVVEVCVWPMILQTVYGLRAVDPVCILAARSMRVSRWQRARWVLLPSAWPFIATGLRLAAVLALLVSIGVELLGAVPGLGLQIALNQTAGTAAAVYALVLIVGALGVLVSQCAWRLERRALRWHPSQR